MKLSKKVILSVGLLWISAGSVSAAATSPASKTSSPKSTLDSPQDWNSWMQSQSAGGNSESSVVQNRVVSKTSRFQVMGMGGFGNRGDLYNNVLLSLSGRYHFNEKHGLEVFRIYTNFTSPTDLNQEVIQKANYVPDVQLSKFQWITSYVYSPIYGKYAWSESSLVHFDIFGSIGPGLRFAKDLQPVLEMGLGMNHYLPSTNLSIVPEFRVRGYAEERTKSTLVVETLTQIGVGWLF